MTKSFLFPDKDLECALRTPLNGLRRCFSSGSFAVFERCGFAAPFSCGGSAPPVGAAARPVRAISSILHKRQKYLPCGRFSAFVLGTAMSRNCGTASRGREQIMRRQNSTRDHQLL